MHWYNRMDFKIGSGNLAQFVCIAYKPSYIGSHSNKHFTFCLLESLWALSTIHSYPIGDSASIYFPGIAKTILFFASNYQYIFFHLLLFAISYVDLQVFLAFCFVCSRSPWSSMLKLILRDFTLDPLLLNLIFLFTLLFTLLFTIFDLEAFTFLIALSLQAAMI